MRDMGKGENEEFRPRQWCDPVLETHAQIPISNTESHWIKVNHTESRGMVDATRPPRKKVVAVPASAYCLATRRMDDGSGKVDDLFMTRVKSFWLTLSFVALAV